MKGDRWSLWTSKDNDSTLDYTCLVRVQDQERVEEEREEDASEAGNIFVVGDIVWDQYLLHGMLF